jgi:hypothetical protein
MDLPRDGRENVHWPITNAPADAQFEAFVAGSWVAMTYDGTAASVLLEGPDAPDHNPEATVVPETQVVKLRVKNIPPELVVRGQGISWVRLID